MTRAFPLLTVFAVVLASGALPGLWANRWTASASLERATARLADLPLTVGDWDGRDAEMDRRQLDVAEVSGHVSRRYVNRRTGDVVTVLLLCGRPGPIAVHTPEICYRGAGYDLAGPRAKLAAPGQAGDLWVSQFRKGDATVTEHLRVFYAWNATGRWEAADNPRAQFARHPALYKLYAARPLLTAGGPLEEDPALDLLRALLPATQKALFPGP